MIEFRCDQLMPLIDGQISNYTIRYYDGKDGDPHKNQMVLVVNDDPQTTFVQSMRVQWVGHSVLSIYGPDVARVVPELVQRLESQPPALILLDYDMPHADGLTVAKQLLKSNSSLNIACVTATSVSDYRPTLAAASVKEQFTTLGIPTISSTHFITEPREVLDKLLPPTLPVHDTIQGHQ